MFRGRTYLSRICFGTLLFGVVTQCWERDCQVGELSLGRRSGVAAVLREVVCVPRQLPHARLSRPLLQRIHQLDLLGPLHGLLGDSPEDPVFSLLGLFQLASVLFEANRCGTLRLVPERLKAGLSEARLIAGLLLGHTLLHRVIPRRITLGGDVARSLKR